MDTSTLSAIPIFSELDERQLRSVATWATERSVGEGETLVREGDFAYDLFFVQDGTAEVTRGGEHLADLGPGDVFGEMGVLTDAQRNATVTARTPMRLITLNHWDLDRLRKEIPQIDEQIGKAMQERLGS